MLKKRKLYKKIKPPHSLSQHFHVDLLLLELSQPFTFWNLFTQGKRGGLQLVRKHLNWETHFQPSSCQLVLKCQISQFSLGIYIILKLES